VDETHPAPSEREQEQGPEREREEDAMRYPGHDDPESVIDPDPDSETETARGGGALRPDDAGT
jgi:hypothetical protein